MVAAGHCDGTECLAACPRSYTNQLAAPPVKDSALDGADRRRGRWSVIALVASRVTWAGTSRDAARQTQRRQSQAGDEQCDATAPIAEQGWRHCSGVPAISQLAVATE
jgi:hypothetical protein